MGYSVDILEMDTPELSQTGYPVACLWTSFDMSARWVSQSVSSGRQTAVL